MDVCAPCSWSDRLCEENSAMGGSWGPLQGEPAFPSSGHMQSYESSEILKTSQVEEM